MICPGGCPQGEPCRYVSVCADLANPAWRRVPVGQLNETHIGRRIRLPLAAGDVVEGALTGLWPFSDEASVLRLHPATSSPALHIVHDSIDVEVW